MALESYLAARASQVAPRRSGTACPVRHKEWRNPTVDLREQIRLPCNSCKHQMVSVADFRKELRYVGARCFFQQI